MKLFCFLADFADLQELGHRRRRRDHGRRVRFRLLANAEDFRFGRKSSLRQEENESQEK